ncbi:MAG TPA: plasma-membrane proton-efflux P-type ATPase [candidate division Zixibacteria bacterium]|nr:plasma-membrane proton-efflux P-type ATPase [candidate division Zixibacteria bacterium]
MEQSSRDGSGLSTAEAEKRLKEFGPNEIPEKKTNPILKFLGYFWGPIPWMIEAAVVLSALIAHWDDFAIILALLFVNAVVGFWQEYKADNAIELLKQRLALKARVLRDGKWSEISARELVPDDAVRVRLGDIAPADIKLVEGDYLLVDQSALTGESLPVEKHVSDVTYAGSVIRQGEMDGFVVGTGINSYFGRTARLVEEAKTRSHFQKAVIRIGNYLIILASTLVIIIFFAALFRHQSILNTAQFALVLLVAAIPVAMPAVLTVTMAVGALALAKKEAIVSKLVSIEEMAGMDVLCSDKTGTITKNELAVSELETFADFTREDALLFGSLASRQEDNDPIDTAVLAMARTSSSTVEEIGHYKIVKFRPFDPVSKRTEATVEDTSGNRFKVTKGAPQLVLSLVPNNKTFYSRVNGFVEAFAEKGYRALGVARTDKQGEWQFVGLFAIYDPPREDSAATVRTAQSMGVSVKMVTGDHIAIAREIASEVGLGSNIVSADSFLEKSDSEAQSVVEAAEGFAQVFPEHKYRIVGLLQERGHIVGMTGDGVNDAPALKKADSGIAVAGATDAAKSAAAIVLTRPGLSVIVDGIRESRKIFERMNNYAIYRVAETIRVLIFLTLAILAFNFQPITALMLVILAMLNDLPIMMIAYDNAKISGRPVRWDMRKVLTIATVLGVAGVFSSFLLLWIGLDVLHLSILTLNTLVFLKLAVAGHMTLYLARTGEQHFWVRPLPSYRLLLATELTQIGATILAVYGILMQPLGWALAGLVWGYSLMFFLINDFVKVKTVKNLNHRNSSSTIG